MHARIEPSLAGRLNVQSSSSAVSAAFAMAIALTSFSYGAFAEPKADIAAATSTWEQAFGGDDPEKILALYADDAVLWGTLSPTVRSKREALRNYFVAAFKGLP